jgi:hypothetical protein
MKEANYTFNFRKSLVTEDSCMISDCVAQVNLSSNCYCYGLLQTESYDISGESLVFKYYQTSLHTDMYIFCGTGGVLVNPLVSDDYLKINFTAPGGCYGSGSGNKHSQNSIVTWGFFVALFIIIAFALYLIIGLPITICYKKKRGLRIIPLFPIILEVCLLVRV